MKKGFLFSSFFFQFDFHPLLTHAHPSSPHIYTFGIMKKRKKNIRKRFSGREKKEREKIIRRKNGFFHNWCCCCKGRRRWWWWDERVVVVWAKRKRAEKNQEKCENKAISWIKWDVTWGNLCLLCSICGGCLISSSSSRMCHSMWIYTQLYGLLKMLGYCRKLHFQEIRGWNEWCSFIACVA